MPPIWLQSGTLTSGNLIIDITSGNHIFTSNNVIIDTKNDISTSKKSILDINNLFWIAAFGEISLVEIQLQISATKLLISRIQFLLSTITFFDIKNSYLPYLISLNKLLNCLSH